jgi:tetratricopeptide (TPR) repeat protein
MTRSQPLRLLCPVLIGRDRELASLEAILREVGARSGRVALIGGDAGIGKSRLLDAFFSRARALGVRTLVGHCAEAEDRRPFGPFIDLLRGARDLPRLVQTESELAGIDPDVRYRALRSFAGILIDLAKQEPLVVAIDDLQWADEATMDLFAYLARALREQQVLLVGSYRTDELHRLHPLRGVLAGLAQARLADSVILQPLTLADTREMIQATLGPPTPTPRELAAALHERCEGNPFFVEEVLKALAETGKLVWRQGSWQQVGRLADLVMPESVRDIVQQRLALLPSETRAALRVAAVIGISFDFALLQRLTGATDDGLTNALRAAVAAQLVDEISELNKDRFRFRHALTRESVLGDLLGRERRELHRRVATALEARAVSDTPPEELAYHFDEAGEREPAFRYKLLAGAHAEKLFAFSNAKKHLERALELAPADADIAELQLRFSRVALLAGDGRAALHAAEDARSRYESREDIRGTALALCAISDADSYLGQADEAIRVTEESVRVLESLGAPCELGDAYRRMAELALFNDDSRTDWAERTIEAGRRCGQPVNEVIGLMSLAGALSQQGRIEAIAHATHAVRLALEMDTPDLVFRARVFLIDVCAKRGAPPVQRRALYEEMVEHAKKHAFSTDLVLGMEVEEAIALGDFDEALHLAGQVTPDSVFGADSELRVTLIKVARAGPEKTSELDSLRRRLLSAAVLWRDFATTTAQVSPCRTASRRARARGIGEGAPACGLAAIQPGRRRHLRDRVGQAAWGRCLAGRLDHARARRTKSGRVACPTSAPGIRRCRTGAAGRRAWPGPSVVGRVRRRARAQPVAVHRDPRASASRRAAARTRE